MSTASAAANTETGSAPAAVAKDLQSLIAKIEDQLGAKGKDTDADKKATAEAEAKAAAEKEEADKKAEAEKKEAEAKAAGGKDGDEDKEKSELKATLTKLLELVGKMGDMHPPKKPKIKADDDDEDPDKDKEEEEDEEGTAKSLAGLKIGINDSGELVIKGGKQFSGARVEKLRDAVASLKGLLDEVGAGKTVSKSIAKSGGEEAASILKALKDRVADLEKSTATSATGANNGTEDATVKKGLWNGVL